MSLSEFDVIQKYFSNLTAGRADVKLGIGDDCALLQPTADQLLAVSTDTLVEGRHFLPGADPYSLGHKSLAVNLSDLAAMGAEPLWVSLALTLPSVDENWLGAFSKGFSNLARQFSLQLIGGDLTQGPLTISISIHGQVSEQQVLKRSGASENELVCVTGTLGDAAFALELLQKGIKPVEEQQIALDRPQPRLQTAQKLRGQASAAIDISDGLLADLGHICESSSVGAEIYLDQLPLSEAVREAVLPDHRWELPLSGGDDYELCFTLPESHQDLIDSWNRNNECLITIIGKTRSHKGIQCLLPDGSLWTPKTKGFEHFS